MQWAAEALLQGLNRRKTALTNGPGCQPDAGQPVRQLLSAGLQSHQGAARAASGDPASALFAPDAALRFALNSGRLTLATPAAPV